MIQNVRLGLNRRDAACHSFLFLFIYATTHFLLGYTILVLITLYCIIFIVAQVQPLGIEHVFQIYFVHMQ